MNTEHSNYSLYSYQAIRKEHNKKRQQITSKEQVCVVLFKYDCTSHSIKTLEEGHGKLNDPSLYKFEANESHTTEIQRQLT